jgi:enoyl-CoA hydratase/carnithine racemase
MPEKAILYQKSEAIGIITINRPEAGNMIDAGVAAELRETCQAISADESIRVIIITGAGDKSFCAGAYSLDSIASGDLQQAEMLSVAVPIAGLKCPTIAAVNGDALGQGLELALACDLRITSDAANFSLPQVASGLIPNDGATQRLQRLVGVTKAMEMILTGQSINAREALQIGLVNRMISRQELMLLAQTMAQTMVTQSPLALSFAKEAIIKGLDLTLEQGLRLEADLYFLLHTTEDRTEGIKAFRDKRTPKFIGK